MGLITSDEFAKVLRVDKYGVLGHFISEHMMDFLQISAINRIYDKYSSFQEVDFLNKVIDEIGVTFDIPESDYKRLPKNGAFISISNHPFGALDGILLLKLMNSQYSDFKILGNYLLHRIAPMRPYIAAVNPFENHKEVKSSIPGIREALIHLREGHPLGIFPAGEVSTYQNHKQRIKDKEWETSMIKFIQMARVPVVPIYFHGKNSILFYILARLNKSFQTAKLPSEFINKKDKVIQIRIGGQVSVEKIKSFKDTEELKDYLRKKTYLLSKSIRANHDESIFKNRFWGPKIHPIAELENQEKISREMEILRIKNQRLVTCKDYEVFLTEAASIPFALKEIGRLREKTFRIIGEGTNKDRDLDNFDFVYKHLILWNNKEDIVVGAYRLGFGKDLYEKLGIKGFYLHTLFKFDKTFHLVLSESIEMGRAFIIKEYQQKPLPLFLLWKGIMHTILKYPEYKYLIGGISISNEFSEFSKALIIEFIKNNYYDHQMAKCITPRNKCKVRLDESLKNFVFNITQSDIKILDNLIEELETDGRKLPILLKKYFLQNAKIIGFNIDPGFNNTIDGLAYIKIQDIPEATFHAVKNEITMHEA